MGEKWNLIVIDNGSSDDTYEVIKNYPTKASDYIYAKIERITNKSILENTCKNYAKPFISDQSYSRFIIDESVVLEHANIKSFCCVATKEVKKELAVCIYSIRCFHSETIYVVCDRETKKYIKHKFDCANIFFDISADEHQLQHINKKYKKQFSGLDNGIHRLDCIYLKMRAIEIALQNEPNTLFVDSDIIFTKHLDIPMYEEVVMSPHFWGAGRPGNHFGIYNAGYLYTSNKQLPIQWREVFIKSSNYCEQECMVHFNRLFNTEVFDENHNVGFWRNKIPNIEDVYSFHSHLFGQPGDRQDVTIAKQQAHAGTIINLLKESEIPVHGDIYSAIEQIQNETDNQVTFIDINGKYLSTSWAHTVMGTPITSNTDSKIKLMSQTVFQSHRSGWSYAIDALLPLHNENGILFDGFLENQFGWTCPTKRYAYDEQWVGVFHKTPNIPDWFFSEYNPEALINNINFQRSLETCKGIYTLSNYHADTIRSMTDVPVNALIHPTEIPKLLFDYDRFIKNDEKKIINIGYWLRKLTSIYQLPVNSYYEKCRLIPYSAPGPRKVINDLMTTETDITGIKWNEFFENTKTLDRVSNVEYDELLSKNIIFLDLYDSSANNAVVECIARGTPLLVNPIPAVIEYLGDDYPFYFTNLEEAAAKVTDFNLIKCTHRYLMNCETRKKLTQEYFKQSLIDSEIYKSL